MQWQLHEGTLLSAMFRENYRRLARYSSKIHCTVSGARCFSADLPQGGLEMPCMHVLFLSRKMPVQRHVFVVPHIQWV